MKTCYVCGSMNEDSFTKCSVCGADLPVTQVQDDLGEEKTTLLQPMGMGYQNPEMGNPNMGMGNPGMTYSPTAAPVPANKGKIFAILGALTVVLIIGFILIFNFGGKTKQGVSTKEDVPKVFIEAMNDRDMDKMLTICPPFLDPGKEDLQAAFDMTDEYGMRFTFTSVTDCHDYTESERKELQDRIQSSDNTNAKIEAAAELTYSYNISMNMMGEAYDEASSDTALAMQFCIVPT